MSTVPITYWWPHADGTLHRWMRDDVVAPPPPPPPPPPVTGYRFPGDTLPKRTGQMLWGIDQLDGDPSERELAGGKPVGAIRRYYKGDSSMAVPNGAAAQQIKLHLSKGRVPWISIAYTDWGAEATGASDSVWDALIAWIEESLPNPGPVVITPMHEPKDNTISTGGNHPKYGTEVEFGRMIRRFRSRMDVYANAHGGVGVYKWKNLAFTWILTADTYAGGSNPGCVDLYWDAAAYQRNVSVSAATDTFTSTAHLLANGRPVTLPTAPAGLSTTTTYYVVSATANTFKLSTTRGGSPVDVTADASNVVVYSVDVIDFAGVDMYEQVPKAGQPYGPLWTSNWVKSLAWCKAHGKAVGLAEWGLPQADPLAASKLTDFYAKLLDGTNDVFLANYFDSDAGTGSTTWLLTNTGNGGCLNAWVDALKDSRSIHFYDTGFPRPAGV